MKLFVLLSSIIFLLSGCSYFSFESNLDPKNIKDYFAQSSVEVYSDKDLVDLDYAEVGSIEGLSCQATSLEAPASEAIARTDAKKQAAEKGANGIVFSKCIKLENTPSCVSSVSCYARMVYIKDE
jgi:RcsF protein